MREAVLGDATAWAFTVQVGGFVWPSSNHFAVCARLDGARLRVGSSSMATPDSAAAQSATRCCFRRGGSYSGFHCIYQVEEQKREVRILLDIEELEAKIAAINKAPMNARANSNTEARGTISFGFCAGYGCGL